MREPIKPATGAPSLDDLRGALVFRKVSWRLLPLLFVCYIIAYIDRINVGFAKLHLREALGVDETVFATVFGLGAGLFFIGYFLFEVPSNLILQRVGARVWIARIMIVWGLVSMSFMFLKGKNMFYGLRFLLGAAEAGFFPGVILYLTYWYPARERARTIAWFAVGGVAAGVIGSPISGALLGLDGLLGFHGWQWLFFLEALPAIILGLVILFVLPNGPEEVGWLTSSEKSYIQSRLDAEVDPTAIGHSSWTAIFRTPVVWLFCLLYFLMNVGSYGYEMWLPTIVKGLSGQGDAMVGVINAIPYFAAGVAMVLVARASDRSGERRGFIAASATTSAIGFVLASTLTNPVLAMAALTLAFMGTKSTIAPFWAWTTSLLSGAAAAGGIALINSVGNLGGFFGPYIVGKLKDFTGTDASALLVLGGSLLGMACFSFFIPKPAKTSQTTTAPEEPATVYP